MNNKNERIKLIEKQNQYISEKLGGTIRKEMAYNLALQEKTLLYQNKKSKIQTQLVNYLSK
jgi:ABC-type histidine transport system ATPase subunit